MQVAVVALLVLVAQADIDQIKAYAGHNAWDAVAGAKSFLDTRLLKRWIARQLTRAERQRLARLHVAAEVETDGRFLFTNFCRAHNCPCENATVAVDTSTGAVFVGYWKGSARWVWDQGRSSVAPESLPCAVLEDFHFGHVPRMTSDDHWCQREEPPLPREGVPGALARVCG